MSIRPHILQNGALTPALEAALATAFEVRRLADQADPQAFLAEHGARFTGLVTSAPAGASAALLASLPALRVISSHGVGLDQIDVAGAAQRGIAVGYTPEVLNDCVADLAMALLLDVARGTSAADRFVRRGDWTQGKFRLARKVTGQRLGILGLGRIGRAIAQRAAGFEMQIRYTNRKPVADVAWTFEPSVVELARWADTLVVITAGGAATRHLVNAEVLEALGSDGFLVNVARGSVVDQAALVQALQQGRIAGAGLDVYADEPNVPAELMALDNVVLLPHIASATRETRQAMEALTVDNLRAFYAGGKVLASALA
ncbi:lactate dehydrogenase-like 2-hydroxyacid dehydrogenase [Rhodoferax ferrireducens]|uniref:Lactate dehydrogenase-like 2-hydroxyacid dehydrogenase n=1 Tax=Rhodoferax ferrireducens TaxID=192843 RepID=A0ABU2CCB2_9BURK|nr:lactate dehydrogenase-like 2-hydroxyacid dehydrogenase [Rhodoferax ferrireducens]